MDDPFPEEEEFDEVYPFPPIIWAGIRCRGYYKNMSINVRSPKLKTGKPVRYGNAQVVTSTTRLYPPTLA